MDSNPLLIFVEMQRPDLFSAAIFGEVFKSGSQNYCDEYNIIL
jgi:hypothetical protein